MHASRARVVLLGAGLVALGFGCATSGGDDGGGFSEDAGDGSDASASHDSGRDAFVGLPDTGATFDEGSPSDAGGASDSGSGTPDTGGGQPDSGECSVLSTTTCSNGAACCIQNDVAACDCQAGTAMQGGTCSMTIACAAGYACAIPQGSASGTCLAWCVYPGGTCPGGTTCQNLFSPSPMAGGVTYGECM